MQVLAPIYVMSKVGVPARTLCDCVSVAAHPVDGRPAAIEVEHGSGIFRLVPASF